MSLYYYDIDFDEAELSPDFVYDNENFFIKYTKSKLDSNVDNLLIGIDDAKYLDSTFALDRFGGKIYWDNISTGGKTILNVFYNPDKIFYLIECGPNALERIFELTDGKVVTGYPVIDRNKKCDIIYKGKHHSTLAEIYKTIRNR